MRTQRVFLLRESAPVAYGGEQRDAFPERDLVRAQLAAELNERLGYPLSAIHVDVTLLVVGAGFQSVDVVAQNDQGEIVIAAAVEKPQEYERNQEKFMRALFRQAAALSRTKKVSFLAYYTRWYQKGGTLQKRQLVVDYAKHPSYHFWQRAGFPSQGVLPAYEHSA